MPTIFIYADNSIDKRHCFIEDCVITVVTDEEDYKQIVEYLIHGSDHVKVDVEINVSREEEAKNELREICEKLKKKEV